MPDWWNSLEPAVKAAIISAGVACVTTVLGFFAVAFQIGRQGHNAVRQSKLNEALKLKVQIYEQTLEVSRHAQAAVSSLTSYLRNFEMSMQFSRLAAANGQNWLVPKARFPEYQKLSSEATTAVVAAVTMIEGWQIVEPRLHIFRKAIAMGLDGYRAAVTQRPNVLVSGMPVEGFEGKWEIPIGEKEAALASRIDIETYQIGRLSAWIGDFQVEMQQLLLGDLFPNNIERRDPPDPEQFCIRLDRYDEIEAKLASSEWGQKAVAMQAEAWARFTTKSDPAA